MIKTITSIIVLIYIMNYFRKESTKVKPTKTVYDERDEYDRKELTLIFGY